MPAALPAAVVQLELDAPPAARATIAPRHCHCAMAAVANFRNARGELSLVENVDMDEATVLAEIASRAEVRNSLPLYLLGQRFGVVAGKPAFDAENLPIGPQALCRMIRQSCEAKNALSGSEPTPKPRPLAPGRIAPRSCSAWRRSGVRVKR